MHSALFQFKYMYVYKTGFCLRAGFRQTNLKYALAHVVVIMRVFNRLNIYTSIPERYFAKF